MTTKKRWVTVLVLGLTLFATITSAATADPAENGATNKKLRASGASKGVHRVGLIPSSESAFRPVPACRVVDTRAGGGKLASGATRSFIIRGSASMVAQGGPAGGCGIPASASSVTANVTVTEQTTAGYLTGTPAGAPASTTNFVSYRSGINITANPVLTLSPVGTEPSLSIFNHGSPAQVIIDVTGYYVPPITAYVTANGATYSQTSRVVSVTRSDVGKYTVQLDTDVNACAAVTTIGANQGASTRAYTAGSTAKVYTYDKAGAPVDADFNLLVVC